MWGVPRALRGETGINIEYTIRRRDTGETWVGSYSFAPIHDQKGKIVGSVVVSRDITDRKKVEEALEYNRNLLRSILDNSPNLIFVTCPDQKFMIVNNALAAKFGLKPEDLIGKSRFDILPEAIARQHSEHDKSILRSRNPMQFEESDTTAKIYLSFKFPLFDNNGKIYAIGGISTDISDLKKAQDILRRDKETFEHLVRERTQELLEAERELEQSKRLTDIGTLAATVAHELRNPLAAITVASTNAKRKLKDERIEKHLQTIERKVKESDQIINNLLFYSRIKPPQTSSVDIIKSIEECAELAAKHSKENIQIEKNIKALVGIKIDADPVQIREIFSNLLSNAFDSMEGRPGKITISATADQKNISITIKDQGVGIHKEDIPRVFETFFTTKSKGTGLGLSVCKQIISLHDGDIHIESELNKGTAVTVTFPRKKRAAMH
jgi:PAS domain S-box-containing protein